MNNLSSIYDVVIVGAGPVGLATAIALYKKGITNILVIDQTQEFRPVGQGLDLLPNGLKAIRHIDEQTYQEMCQAHVSSNPSPPPNSNPTKGIWQHRNLEGEIVRSTPLNFDFWTEKYGEGRASLKWFSVQTILRNHLPPEFIQIGRRCCDLSQDDELVKLTLLARSPETNPFAHWQMQKAQVEPSPEKSSSPSENIEQTPEYLQAKLVVAADGIHSQIRQVLYRHTPLENWANPHYSGFSAIGCFQSKVLPSELYQALDDRYLQGERIVSVYPTPPQIDSLQSHAPRIIITRKPDGAMGYLLHLPLGETELVNKLASEIIEIAKQALLKANFPRIIADLIGFSNPEQLLYRAYYLHPANIASEGQRIWSQGRVVLAGDAAHGMPPFTAQGANQGFEDAALLGNLITRLIQAQALDNQEKIAQAFKEYEKIRRPFLSKLQEITLRNSNLSQSEWEDYNNWVYGRDIALISQSK